MEDDLSVHVISIIALVVIVGLVAFFMNKGSNFVVYDTTEAKESNLAGEAVRSTAIKYSYVIHPIYQLKAIDRSSCEDTDAWVGDVTKQHYHHGDVMVSDTKGSITKYPDTCSGAKYVIEGTCNGDEYKSQPSWCANECVTQDGTSFCKR